jgi:hypothetical protein
MKLRRSIVLSVSLLLQSVYEGEQGRREEILDIVPKMKTERPWNELSAAMGLPGRLASAGQFPGEHARLVNVSLVIAMSC